MKTPLSLVYIVGIINVALFIALLFNAKAFQSTDVDNASALIETKKQSVDNVTRVRGANADEIEHLDNSVSLINTEMLTLSSQLNDLKDGLETISKGSQQDLIVLRQEFAELKKLLKNINDKNNQLSSNIEDPNKSNNVPERVTIDSLKEADQRLTQENLERWETMSASFQSEQIDGQWSTDTMQEITDLFENSSVIKAELSQIDCRATLCFVEAQLKNKDEARNFSTFFPMKIGRTLPNANYSYETHEDGSISVSMYLEK